MSRHWSAIVIVISGGFFLLVLIFQDIATPNAVVWERAEIEGIQGARAAGLVLQGESDGVLFASAGFSVYRSEGSSGFLKVYRAKPPPGLSWIAHVGTYRRLLGLEEVIDVFPLSDAVVLVAAGGEISRVDLAQGAAERVHRLRYYGLWDGRGVGPSAMAMDEGGRVYYGEQVARKLNAGETIALFRSDDQGRSFEIVHELSADAAGSFRTVTWDAHGQALWVSVADGDAGGRVGFSRDFGETFTWIGEPGPAYRAAALTFSEGHVDWLSEGDGEAARLVRWHREGGDIRILDRALPGRGHGFEPIGDDFGLLATAADAASLWLVGPALSVDSVMTWQPVTSGWDGFGRIRLVHGRAAGDDGLYMSPALTEEQKPSILRFARHEVFKAVGVAVPSEPRLSNRDDLTGD